MTTESNCKFCGGKTSLPQRGIMQVYLFPNKLSLSLIVLGAALALLVSKYWLILSAAACIIPLVNADFRLYLYPFVALGKLSGKEVNCPKCAVSGTIFK
ncbi:MAG: hypothetical protein WC637_21710 [Victivallales bacterium]|jgi:hypothetical protein